MTILYRPYRIVTMPWTPATLGTEDAADTLELRAYLAGMGEERPALRQQVVVHRCREYRQEWRDMSKGRVPARVSEQEPTEVVEVDDPEEEGELETSHVGRRGAAKLSQYVPRSIV
jgi:hypothetical protein